MAWRLVFMELATCVATPSAWPNSTSRSMEQKLLSSMASPYAVGGIGGMPAGAPPPKTEASSSTSPARRLSAIPTSRRGYRARGYPWQPSEREGPGRSAVHGRAAVSLRDRKRRLSLLFRPTSKLTHHAVHHPSDRHLMRMYSCSRTQLAQLTNCSIRATPQYRSNPAPP